MGNGPFIEVYLLKIVIFHGYVKYPGGNIHIHIYQNVIFVKSTRQISAVKAPLPFPFTAPRRFPGLWLRPLGPLAPLPFRDGALPPRESTEMVGSMAALKDFPRANPTVLTMAMVIHD